MLAIDHAIVTVVDPSATAERLASRAGLRAVEGGRHSGHGTGNWIVPLGDSYLELMTVVDPEEAEGSPLGRWVLRHTRHGDRLSALCLRTDDIEEIAARTGHGATPMSRQLPDGTELRWRLVGLPAALSDDALPFFIQWGSGGDHPGRMDVEHAVTVAGIAWVEYGGDAGRLGRWLGDHSLPIRVVGERSGPRRLAIMTGDGPVVLNTSVSV